MKTIAAFHLIVAAIILHGCAATEIRETEEILDDVCHSVAGAIGRVVCEAGKVIPGVEQAIDAADSSRRRAKELNDARKARATDRARDAHLGTICSNDPCNEHCIEHPVYGGFCMSDAASDVSRQNVAVASRLHLPSSTLIRERIKREEGGFLYTVTDGHICAGHSIRANRDAHRFAGRTVTEAECEALLDEDIETAQIRAERFLGTQSDAAIISCYLKGCGDYDGVQDAIDDLERTGTVRAKRLARELGHDADVRPQG